MNGVHRAVPDVVDSGAGDASDMRLTRWGLGFSIALLLGLLVLGVGCGTSSQPDSGSGVGPAGMLEAGTPTGQGTAATATATETGGAAASLEPLSDARAGSGYPSPAEREQLPSCDGTAFSVAPVDLAELNEITPLGNVAPPSHTMPTEHTYLHFRDALAGTTEVYPLLAPGDVTLLLVRSSEGARDPEDHSITFALCQDVYGYFNHVKFLSDELTALLAEQECFTYTNDDSGSCEKPLFALVPAGTLLGQVGRLQGNFDFGALDVRVTHPFANDDRYEYARTPHIVCPYDYYEGELQEQLYALLARTEEPRCGVVAVDVSGTLQGAWYGPGSDAVVGWNEHLALIRDNYDPALGLISVGGRFSEPGRVEFTPTSSGTINRAFDEVTADGTLYCYERDGSGRHEQVQNPDLLSGKMLIELVSATELQIERQSGGCGADERFDSPTSYFR